MYNISYIKWADNYIFRNMFIKDDLPPISLIISN
jgi:hypothetical protein